MSLALSLIRRPYVELDFTRMAFDTRVSFSRSSTATRFRADKVLETVASNTPRINHDPLTGAVRGLLLEEQRTNLHTRSREMHDSSWLASNAAKTANAAVSPDGTTTATQVSSMATSGGVCAIRQSITYAAGVHTSSFDVKAGTTTYCAVRPNPPTGFAEVRFDLTTGDGSVSTGSPIAYGSTALDGGWWRCWVSITATAGAGSSYVYVYTPAGSRVWYSNSGEYIYTTNAQIEAGATASSRIITTTAAVTRAADVASFTIPARVVRLVTVYYDGTTNTETVTPGATYTIPTGTKPILRIRGYFA